MTPSADIMRLLLHTQHIFKKVNEDMKLDVRNGSGIQVSHLNTEIVERKGKGHPDTLCDMASEELSVKLCEYYIERYGRIMHHNVDKCVLVGGQSNSKFGGGEVIEPIYLLLVGRAVGGVGDDEQVPIGRIAVKHTGDVLKKQLRFLNVDSDIIIDYKIKSGSVDLVGNFEGDVEIPRANDTSLAVAYAPLTETEKITLEVEKYLNSSKIKRKYPAIGEDIKVMGVRRGRQIDLTIAVAVISSQVASVKEYNQVKRDIKGLALEIAGKITDKKVRVYVNTADDSRNKTYFLTVTGTSAEHGDDGQVGRGNRANGLITPYRPMTLEAAAGKNPVTHVGKIYNVTAQQIVDTLIKEEPEVEQASCYLVSQIGAPINEPQVVDLEVYSEKHIDQIMDTAHAIVEDALEEIPNTWKGFMKREYKLF